jgi:predicted HD superfamily hydrolase involved in NAD metabolism
MTSFSLQKLELIKDWVKTQVSPRRFLHIQGVAQTAVKLALRHDHSAQKAEMAAWLHDCAKELHKADMLKWIKKGSFSLDAEEKKIPALWHPHAGAGLAKIKWGIKDKDVLEAIRCHTLGSPEMGPLAQVVFVADFIEPGRTFEGVEKVRLVARKDLNEAVLLKCSMTVEDLLSRQMKIHGRLLATWNRFLEEKG